MKTRVRVTWRDRLDGRRGDPDCCPLALAMSRALGAHVAVYARDYRVFVSPLSSYREFVSPLIALSYPLPAPAARWVRRLDRSRWSALTAWPFTFTVDRP